MEPNLAETALTFENIPPPDDESQKLAERIKAVLEEHSALDILDINTRGKSSVADSMLIASGRSNRHVSALADYVRKDLKEIGHEPLAMEGAEKADWVLIDAGDVILHLFRPEVRVFYNLEKIWSLPLPESLQTLAEASPEE
jgi:ribosome-associated protein